MASVVNLLYKLTCEPQCQPVTRMELAKLYNKEYNTNLSLGVFCDSKRLADLILASDNTRRRKAMMFFVGGIPLVDHKFIRKLKEIALYKLDQDRKLTVFSIRRDKEVLFQTKEEYAFSVEKFCSSLYEKSHFPMSAQTIYKKYRRSERGYGTFETFVSICKEISVNILDSNANMEKQAAICAISQCEVPDRNLENWRKSAVVEVDEQNRLVKFESRFFFFEAMGKRQKRRNERDEESEPEAKRNMEDKNDQKTTEGNKEYQNPEDRPVTEIDQQSKSSVPPPPSEAPPMESAHMDAPKKTNEPQNTGDVNKVKEEPMDQSDEERVINREPREPGHIVQKSPAPTSAQPALDSSSNPTDPISPPPTPTSNKSTKPQLPVEIKKEVSTETNEPRNVEVPMGVEAPEPVARENPVVVKKEIVEEPVATHPPIIVKEEVIDPVYDAAKANFTSPVHKVLNEFYMALSDVLIRFGLENFEKTEEKWRELLRKIKDNNDESNLTYQYVIEDFKRQCPRKPTSPCNTSPKLIRLG